MTDEECLNDGAYVLGSLSPGERQSYERHLAGCVDCQASVRRLAGLPGLLALVGEETLSEPPAVPPTLLPSLLRQVGGARRRRSVYLAGSLALAAVCAAVLVIVLAIRPVTPTTPPAQLASAIITMTPQVKTPMGVTVSLTDKQWGTSITIVCSYDEKHDAGVPYELYLVDRSAQAHDVGSWASVAGSGSTVTAATALHRAEIAGFEVRLPDGRVILQGTV